MSISILNTENAANPDLKSNLHLIPCKIHSNGEAPVEKYFTPLIKNDSNDLQSSFRGYKLNGQNITVPDNYIGVALTETTKQVTEDQDRKFYVTKNFDKFTYWNWDKKATKNDSIHRALQWINIAEALHSPVPDED